MEAAITSETSTNFYEIIRRNIQESYHKHIHRRKNVESHFLSFNRANLTVALCFSVLRISDQRGTTKAG